MALHAGDSITAIKGNREICYCAGESSSGWQGCRELLRPGNLLRGIFITHFLPLLLGCEAVAAGLCVILRGMQLWFAGRSRSGAGEVMLGDTISHGRGTTCCHLLMRSWIPENFICVLDHFIM